MHLPPHWHLQTATPWMISWSGTAWLIRTSLRPTELQWVCMLNPDMRFTPDCCDARPVAKCDPTASCGWRMCSESNGTLCYIASLLTPLECMSGEHRTCYENNNAIKLLVPRPPRPSLPRAPHPPPPPSLQRIQTFTILSMR